ncbi:hypothetical protein [Sphingomonas sp. DT-204]|uniref:hypothetical protein n=1 Tax=Sphingomonas sp. DT-204 TaxID=3396166 RepID=UPI003F1D07D5
MDDADERRVDPERRQQNAFDVPGGYSGQDYHREREEQERRRAPGGQVHPGLAEADRTAAPAGAGGKDIPPENGRRAWIDPATGAVHGAGAGAGGGAAGEDFDSDPQAGDGYPATGAAGEAAAREAAGNVPDEGER